MAVASTNPETASLVPKGCRIFQNWRSLLDSRCIDGVIIATPANTHAEIALAALDLHIPALIEKPLALSIEDAEALMQSSIKNQTYATVNHVHLFNPAFRRMVELVPKYGSIVSISGIAGGPGPYRSDCSVLWDWGPHDIAMMLKIIGRYPTKVTGKKIPVKKGAPDYAEEIYLKLQFGSALEAFINISNNRRSKIRSFEIVAQNGTLLYDDCARDKLISSCLYEDVRYLPAAPLLLAINDFVDNISMLSTDTTGLKLGLDVVKVIKSVIFI